MFRTTRKNAAGLIAGAVFTFGLAGSALAQAPAGSGSVTLDNVRKRGELLCGISGAVPGFSLPDSQGVMRGLDADSCRAVAAAALGDANKVKFVVTTTQNRFTALQSGEVDMLSRSTTWTLGREANLGLEFAWVNYYDGTGFLVKKSAGVKAAKEMDGATDLRAAGHQHRTGGSPTIFRLNNMKFTPILIADLPEIQGAFLSGRCDAYSTDASALATFRFSQGPKADDLVLLPEHHQQGTAGRDGAQGRRQMVRHRALDLHRDDHRRGKGRHQQERRHLRRQQGPRHPPPARARGRHGQGARRGQQMGLQRRSSRSAISARCGTATSRRWACRAASTTSGPRAACSTRRRSADAMRRGPAPPVLPGFFPDGFSAVPKCG